MSAKFQGIMRELHATLTTAYGGEAAILVPGGGTYAMEAVARQFVRPEDAVLVIRNGYFSFRWSQIFEKSRQEHVTVKKAQPQEGSGPAAFAPVPIEEVV